MFTTCACPRLKRSEPPPAMPRASSAPGFDRSIARGKLADLILVDKNPLRLSIISATSVG